MSSLLNRFFGTRRDILLLDDISKLSSDSKLTNSRVFSKLIDLPLSMLEFISGIDPGIILRSVLSLDEISDAYEAESG